jgi:hypothetical protein
MKKIKLYVGCALNNAPKEFVGGVLALRKELSNDPAYEVLEFLGPGEPQAIYDTDIKECVMKADAMLAVCDVPSLGLGYEMGVLVTKQGKPLFAVAHTTSNVSKLVQGINEDKVPFAFKRYENLSSVPAMLKKWLVSIGKI